MFCILKNVLLTTAFRSLLILICIIRCTHNFHFVVNCALILYTYHQEKLICVFPLNVHGTFQKFKSSFITPPGGGWVILNNGISLLVIKTKHCMRHNFLTPFVSWFGAESANVSTFSTTFLPLIIALIII